MTGARVECVRVGPRCNTRLTTGKVYEVREWVNDRPVVINDVGDRHTLVITSWTPADAPAPPATERGS